MFFKRRINKIEEDIGRIHIELDKSIIADIKTIITRMEELERKTEALLETHPNRQRYDGVYAKMSDETKKD